MFNTNPFAELSAMIDPSIMQVYVIIMALLVAGGTLFDVVMCSLRGEESM